MTKRSPFATGIPGSNMQYVDADSRIRAVQHFSIEECNEALHVRGLQKTVALAILRRVRKIKAEAGA